MNKLLKTNSKLRKDGIISTGLPPVKTCPMAGSCKKICYAQKGMYRVHHKDVKPKWERDLAATKSPEFIDRVVAELKAKRKQPKAVRVHSEGDFYDQAYLDKWTEIARRMPEIRFYCYTKSLHLDWSGFCSLPNTKRIQSCGGVLDHNIDRSQPHAIVFDNAEQLQRAGYVNCSNDDLLASMDGVISIGLIKH